MNAHCCVPYELRGLSERLIEDSDATTTRTHAHQRPVLVRSYCVGHSAGVSFAHLEVQLPRAIALYNTDETIHSTISFSILSVTTCHVRHHSIDTSLGRGTSLSLTKRCEPHQCPLDRTSIGRCKIGALRNRGERGSQH